MSADDVPTRIVGIVYGSCPMGCGQTLQVDTLGNVTCYSQGCPRPDAVAVLLADVETEHLVQVGEFGYTIQHPLKERLEGQLFECPAAAAVSDEVARRLQRPGVFRVEFNPDGGVLAWEFLAGPDADA